MRRTTTRLTGTGQGLPEPSVFGRAGEVSSQAPSALGSSLRGGQWRRRKRPAAGTPAPLATTRQTDQAAERFTVESLVADFTSKLLHHFPDRVKRRPKPLKRRVLALVRLGLPPYSRSAGRPPEKRITQAVAMFLEQQREVREGRRKRVNWMPIAEKCVSGFSGFRSIQYRRLALERLRNAVYARVARENKLKAKRRSRRVEVNGVELGETSSAAQSSQ